MRRFFVLVFILMALVHGVACGDPDNALSPYSEALNVSPSTLARLGQDSKWIDAGLYAYTGKSEKTATFRVLQAKSGRWSVMETITETLKPGSLLLCDVEHDAGAYVLRISYADDEGGWEHEIPLELPFMETDGRATEYLSEKIRIDTEACILSFDMSPYGVTESDVYSISEYPNKAPKDINQRILTIDVR